MCGFMFSGDSKLPKEKFEKGFRMLVHRGPDESIVAYEESGIFGFHRLSIMGLDHSGMQPFRFNGNILMCNGEIYGFRKWRDELEQDYAFQSESDCEVLLPMYQKYGLEMFRMLDAEFVMVMYDHKTKDIIAARDPIGIRPLFYGYLKESGKIAFASEMKALVGLCDGIQAFPIGSYYSKGEFVQYRDMTEVDHVIQDDMDTISKEINERLTTGIVKRLDADAPLGFLLSGGLDSSLVCSIARKHLGKPIKTFAIGMEKDAIDLKYAKEVADYIKSDHTEVIINKQDVLDALKDVIYTLETYDITTIRASVGMYLICKAIRRDSDVKVLLTGEISDELFGYKYTDFAPSAEEFQEESAKRIRELYMYDVLRADRSISAHGLEARVPFGDLDFVSYVMAIDPEKKMNKYNMGKYLLRKAFEGDYLPNSILYREKAAFSDAVGHSLVDEIKAHAERLYKDEEVEALYENYSYHAKPYTKESLMYREIFESFYSKQATLIKDYWLPNQTWEGCQTREPSARVLSNYGKSGE